MHFDVFTALAASSFVILLLGAVLAFFWRRGGRSPWLIWLASAYFLTGFGNFLAIVARVGSGAPAFAAGSTVFFLGFCLIWQATRVFERRRPLPLAIAVYALGFPSLFLIPGIHGNLDLRIAVVSVPLAASLILAASELWRGRREGLPSKMPFVALLTLAALIIVGRLVFGADAAYPIGARPASDGVVILIVGGLPILAILMMILALTMELERLEQGQRHLATTDPMTGFLNRRGLEDVLPDGRLPAGSALVVFDLDHFKQVNDSFGHAAGDALIATFALICREELHQVDHAARLGGEEFVLVLARADNAAALAIAERVRERYARTVVPVSGGAVAGTVSGGVFAAAAEEPFWLTAAIAAADRAMYRAKTNGRNRVFVSESSSRDFDKRCVDPNGQAASA